MLTKHIRFKALLVLVAAMLLAVTGLAARAAAVNQLVAQGYQSDTNLQPGMVVRLDPLNLNKVTALDLSHISGMLGVVITANEAALTLSQPTSSSEVYVSNFGQHDVLVTTQNGPIRSGNYVTISAIAGLGMKADANETEVLGRAAGTFDGQKNVLSTAQVTDSAGKKITVSIGIVPVDINIASNPLAVGAKGVPTFLNKITKFATNKYVSASRIYLSMLCVVAGLILTITIVYSGIKNGFISIGRNPLAKRVIVLNLVRVVLISLGIFVVSLGVAYVIVTQ